MKHYFIFGLQRSGTNYLQALLDRNFYVENINDNLTMKSWKHSIDLPAVNNLNITPKIIITKHPYTWIESLAWRDKVDWAYTQTLYPAHEMGNADLNVGRFGFNLVNLIKTYNHFVNTWILDNSIDNRYILRYEDLLDETIRIRHLKSIHEKFSLKKTLDPDTWFNPKDGAVLYSSKYNSAEHKEYYANVQPKFLTRQHINIINDMLADVMDTLCYKTI